MDADALLSKIESIVEKKPAASAASAPSFNWGAARAMVTKAKKRIRRARKLNGVHQGVLMGALPSPSKKAKRKAAGRKAARTRATEQAKREAAGRKAARTRLKNEEKRAKAAAKAARTKARKEEAKRLSIIKAKSTRTRNANKKAKSIAKAKRTRTRTINAKRTGRRKHGRK